jgi:hypothetical protein
MFTDVDELALEACVAYVGVEETTHWPSPTALKFDLRKKCTEQMTGTCSAGTR